MKKSSKIILITSGCLILGGLLIAVIAGTVGGTRQMQELADKHALTFNMPWDGKLKITMGGLYFTNDEQDEDESVDVQTEQTEAFSAEDITKIELKLGAGEVEIKESYDEEIHVEASKGMNLRTKVNGNVIEIEAGKNGEVQILGFSVGTGVNGVGRAIIYLPEKEYEEIALSMGAGTCTGEIPAGKKVKIDIGAGECDFDFIKGDEVELDVGAGECKIGRIEAAELDADIAMGELEAKVLVEKELDAKVGMGEITMEIIGDESEFDYDVEVGAGEVRIGSRSYSGVGSGGSQDNGLNRNIEVECGMGEATLRFVEG